MAKNRQASKMTSIKTIDGKTILTGEQLENMGGRFTDERDGFLIYSKPNELLALKQINLKEEKYRVIYRQDKE